MSQPTTGSQETPSTTEHEPKLFAVVDKLHNQGGDDWDEYACIWMGCSQPCEWAKHLGPNVTMSSLSADLDEYNRYHFPDEA